MAQFLKRLFCSLRGHPGHYAEAEHLQFYVCHCPNCGAQFERMELAREKPARAAPARVPVRTPELRQPAHRQPHPQPVPAPAMARYATRSAGRR